MLPDVSHPSACGEQGLLCQTECIKKKHLKGVQTRWAPPPDHQMVLKVIGPQGSNHGPRGGGGMRGCARAARANAAAKGGGMVKDCRKLGRTRVEHLAPPTIRTVLNICVCGF